MWDRQAAPAGGIAPAEFAPIGTWITKDARNVGFFDIYKRGQGRYARIITVIGVMVIGLGGAVAMSSKLVAMTPVVQFGVPSLLVVALGVFIFWVINRPQSADFLIATEGEMKKVSWSTRKEIVGSTKVVIIATFILGVVLYTVDFLFALLFTAIGVMGG